MKAVSRVLIIVLLVGMLGYALQLSLPTRPPKLENVLAFQPTDQEVGSYDVLGQSVSKSEAAQLLQNEGGKAYLAPENGAIEITDDLIQLGRDAFYRETFGNERFFTDVLGAIDGPINLVSVSQAILALKGQPTTNLQIPISEDITIGGHEFKAGTKVDTGLDVAAGSLLPLGMQVVKSGAKIRVGLTCALCHAAVDMQSGKVIEGAPNTDLDSGLLQAFGTNSAAMFRQTGVNPLTIPQSENSTTYINAKGQKAKLPDPKALEDAVDAQFLAWAPGNFDSTGDNVNNPSQNPSSYTFEAYPYGWSGFSSIGWFHGLTTLNNNVHATNSDPTTGANASEKLLGIDKETYLGVILQNSADRKFRLPNGKKPSTFFQTVDPTPREPAINEVIKAPGFPQGSLFIADGFMASSPGYKVGEQLNAMSAYQNTLAPPPVAEVDRETLQRGARIFQQANCTSCHVGRYFTNHAVIAESEIQAQPSRAVALSKFPRIFGEPQTYAPNTPVPLPVDPPILTVPVDTAPEETRNAAYAIDPPDGGYKVTSLVGLAVTAPYLHDGGVAASKDAIVPQSDGRYTVAKSDEMGLAGTWMQRIAPDPEASLRVLVDRDLRAVAVKRNRSNPDLQAIHSDGSGHNYWVDREAGFSPEDQTDLVRFLLSIDDTPAITFEN
ncbi:hypothetical protein IQ250_16405 [Pseudanabaenaceae cyanobacterium LEGE 13415]|nr:hypothetical protein [Pseudanabaenaceae cyanobacterium LEGE 13415]